MNQVKAPTKFLILPAPATARACWHSMPWNISAGAENKTLVFLDLFTFPLKNGSLILLCKLLFWSCLHALDKPKNSQHIKPKMPALLLQHLKRQNHGTYFSATPYSFQTLMERGSSTSWPKYCKILLKMYLDTDTILSAKKYLDTDTFEYLYYSLKGSNPYWSAKKDWKIEHKQMKTNFYWFLENNQITMILTLK